MKIEAFQFGKIMVGGKLYVKDLIIFPTHVSENWWRKSGHNIVVEDIGEILDAVPEILVVGTGTRSQVKISPEAMAALLDKKIQIVAYDTEKAIAIYNGLTEENAVAALHLTC
jgi:hypothetical protein